jgi:hypothetical protein
MKRQAACRGLEFNNAKVKRTALALAQVLPFLLPRRPEVAAPGSPTDFQQLARLADQIVRPAAAQSDIADLTMGGMKDRQSCNGNRGHLDKPGVLVGTLNAGNTIRRDSIWQQVQLEDIIIESQHALHRQADRERRLDSVLDRDSYSRGADLLPHQTRVDGGQLQQVGNNFHEPFPTSSPCSA